MGRATIRQALLPQSPRTPKSGPGKGKQTDSERGVVSTPTNPNRSNRSQPNTSPESAIDRWIRYFYEK